MAWTDTDSWLTRSFGPHLSTIFLTALIALFLPVLLHYFLYKTGATKAPPSFLLVGPSGAGKTALLTLLETGRMAPTHTSQMSTTTTASLPRRFTPASRRYRSAADAASSAPTTFRLTDLPGHGKLRPDALARLAPASSKSAAASASSPPPASAGSDPSLRGVVFLLDAAAHLSTPAALADAAAYLHDVLLALQRRHTGRRSSRNAPEVPVLVALNKQDLFSAVPAAGAARRLEAEVGRVRETRARGLVGAGEGEGGEGAGADEEEREWLGETGAAAFEFAQMREVNVAVEVLGGSVLGESEGRGGEGWKEGRGEVEVPGGGVDKWLEWMAEQL